MRVIVRVLPFLVLSARLGLAACDPSVDPDLGDVANVRAAVAAACDCATTASHGDYVRCATAQADATLVNKDCAGAVRRCAARSTCGKPGSVTCCRTRSSGKTTCAIKRSAAGCRAPARGAACVGSLASCCDACGPSGCVTTTTSTTSTTVPSCGGAPEHGFCLGPCDSPFDECRLDTTTGLCGCFEAPCRAVGGFGSCGGTCPTPATCTFTQFGCECVAPCYSSAAPACAGDCVPPQVCSFNPTTSACGCGP